MKTAYDTMEIIHTLFGEGKDLNALQTSCRALVIFLITLGFIRISGMRTFGLKSAFDNIIVIMLGAVMSRPIVGASPFWPTIAGGLMIALVHRLLAWISMHNKALNKAVRGTTFNLYKDEHFNRENLAKCNLTVDEVMGEVRDRIHDDTLNRVREIYMEASGKISIVKKEP